MTGSRSTHHKRPSSPRAAPRPAHGALEIVNQTMDEVANLDGVYDALASLLLRYYRQRQSPSEARTG